MVVFVTTGAITLQGIKFDRDEMTISVWFVNKAMGSTDTETLYEDVEKLWALLHTNPRLAGLTDCQYAKVAGYRQLFGQRLDYFIDVMEVIVNVKLYRRF